jgi:predicted lipid-binding transport protein (Tim44 family)
VRKSEREKLRGDTPVTDEIRKDDALLAKELTTADFVAAGEQRAREIEIESRTAEARIESAPAGATATGGAAAAAAPAKSDEDRGPLFTSDEANNFRSRWDKVQVAFVDEPRQAVQDADRLVADTMKRLAEIIADERQKLENQWDRGDSVSTEDLRLALRRYRSFFSRLLNI